MTKLSRTMVGVTLTFLVLLLNLLAASPSLHQSLHHDANHAEHQCAVSLFAHGKLDAATVDVAAAVTWTFAQESSRVDFSPFCPAIDHLPAGRAPPKVSSNS